MSNLNDDVTNEHVSPEQVPGAHDSDGTLGRTAGTGTGAIAGGMLGSAVGPLGTVVGAIAGAVLGNAAGNAAHDIGDDHDDVNVRTGSDGELGRDTGMGAGAISGAVVGSAAGPVGTVAGAVAGGMLGAAAGDAAKDFGGPRTERDITDVDTVDTSYATTTGVPAVNAADYDTTTTAGYGTTNVGTVNDADHIRVPVMEEQLNVQKTMQQSGEVAVHKHVIEEQVNVPVEVSREQVTIERHATDRPLQAGETLLNDGDVIRVPVMEETVNVTKSAHVVEEIEIGKTRTTEQQNVSDTVRKEQVEIVDPTRDNRTI